MASSVKRVRSPADENPSPAKKPSVSYTCSPVGSSLPPIVNPRVVLNPADCDLDFNIEGNGLIGSALYEHGFAYCWSGARANIAITGGKYCFSCKIMSGQPVDIDDIPHNHKHVSRVGISRRDERQETLGKLRKFSNSGKFSSFGERFDIGDTILCAVDLENKPIGTISFAKNGKWLGTACQFNGGSNWESAFFPHVLLKNVVVQLQFSYEDGLVPQQGYRPWAYAFKDGNGFMGPSFSDVCNRELIMMVGLPASGKTTWAERWADEHPEKRYIVLGTNSALDQMKVPGLLRKQNYGERFDKLMDRATAIFNTLLTRASKTPRNFIIDQTNVYKSARKRKLKPFANYQKIAVVAFPRPEDLKARSEKRFREMGKEVPVEAVNEMIANFVLPKSKDMPGTDEYFDQIVYIELNMREAKICLDEMKAKLQSDISFSPYSRERHAQFSHSISCYGHGNSLPAYVTSPLQYQMTPGGHLLGSYEYQAMLQRNDRRNEKFQPRDDINHRRSYSGYEHRAIAPKFISNPYQKSSFHNNETMDVSPM